MTRFLALAGFQAILAGISGGLGLYALMGIEVSLTLLSMLCAFLVSDIEVMNRR